MFHSAAVGSSDSAIPRPPPLAPVHIVDAAGGAQGTYRSGRGMRGSGGWVVNWLICCWGWGRAGDQGRADYAGNCQLQCLQSGSNRFLGWRVGGVGGVTVDFSSQLFARATLPG